MMQMVLFFISSVLLIIMGRHYRGVCWTFLLLHCLQCLYVACSAAVGLEDSLTSVSGSIGSARLQQQSLYAGIQNDGTADYDINDGTLFAEVNFKIDSINDVDEQGETLLTQSASSGAVRVVRNYIRAGANVNFTNSKGYTALMLAVERGHYLTSVELVRAYTDLSVRSPSGMTAFLLAISGNHTDIAVSIADHGGDINDNLPRSKITGLMMAAQKGYSECVEFLVSRGVDVNAESSTKESALLFAAVSAASSRSSNGTISPNLLKVLELLVGAGANVDHVNENKISALMLATSRRNVEVARFLIASGANVSLKNEFGMSSIDIAFENDDKQMMAMLKEHGAVRSKRKR
jgi:ankyrin repeat protein